MVNNGMLNAELIPATSNRVPRSLALRTETTAHDAFVAPPAQIDNGDEARYADKSGTYTKGVLQSGVGLVDLAAYQSFKAALSSGAPADFENIVLGPGGRTLNGPQGGLAFYQNCLDSSQFGGPPAVPPAPKLAGVSYATELIELYWASLLRDVAFTDYPGNFFAEQAANELSSPQLRYAGPRDAAGNVTPELLFRGGFAGETIGPYVSQFLLQEPLPNKVLALGALPIRQQYLSNKAGRDFMKEPDEFLAVQNGATPDKLPKLMQTGPFYLHDGRGLAAYTHADVLYQAYFIAYLVLSTIKHDDPDPSNPYGETAAPPNPGNPYIGSKTQNGFGAMGPPDIAATLAAVARQALNAEAYSRTSPEMQTNNC